MHDIPGRTRQTSVSMEDTGTATLSFIVSNIVSVAVFVTLLCTCIVIGHLLEENRWANEAITSLLLGLCAGLVTLLVSNWKSSRILVFNEEMFFIYLLPPIIFNAGFQVKKKQFFQNFSTIMLFGMVGTLVLKQEETPLLYSLVFGEGVVNDATSIVLFNSAQTLDFKDIDVLTALRMFGTFLYLFATSTALGVAVGLVSAYLIKKLYFGRHSTNREVAIMLLLAYLSYIVAELLSLSGILTIFFCGIIMSHYTWHNVSERSKITTRHAFATMSFIAETFIFLYVGMDALDIDKWKQSHASVGKTVAVSGTIYLLVMFARAIFILSLANFANCFRTGNSRKIDLRRQFVIWWAGLMRGAVTIALSYEQFSSTSSLSEDDAFMITNSIIVVLFSNVVLGSVTKPLIQSMLSRDLSPQSEEDNQEIQVDLLELRDGNERGDDRINHRSGLGLLIAYPTSTIHNLWRRFDDRYMRPMFGGHGFVPYPDEEDNA